MSARSATLRGRIFAESLMVDQVTVSRPGVATFNPSTGQTSSTPTVVHTGPARLRMPSVVESTSIFGEREVTKSRFVVDFPHDVTTITLADYITVDASEDPVLLTKVFEVVAVPAGTYTVTRSVGCEVVE